MFARFQWKFYDEILCPQDFHLFDRVLTPRTVLQILSLENPLVYSDTHSNLDIEVISKSQTVSLNLTGHSIFLNFIQDSIKGLFTHI